MRGIVITAGLFLMSVIQAKAQALTSDKMPPTSGCYKPWTYDRGVNLMILVHNFNGLQVSDVQPLVVSRGLLASDLPLQGTFPIATLDQIMVNDLSRLKDIAKITWSGLPKDDSGNLLIHFQATIDLAPIKTTAGKNETYVAVTHLQEVCSGWGEGKDFGVSIREVDTPGVLINSNMDALIRDLEDYIYDLSMKVVNARRQDSVRGAAPEKR
jgi:hypothetical protein